MHEHIPDNSPYNEIYRRRGEMQVQNLSFLLEWPVPPGNRYIGKRGRHEDQINHNMPQMRVQKKGANADQRMLVFLSMYQLQSKNLAQKG